MRDLHDHPHFLSFRHFAFLSIFLSFRHSACLSFCLSLCLTAYLSPIRLSVFLSVSLLTSEKRWSTLHCWVRLSVFPVFRLSVFLSYTYTSFCLSFCLPLKNVVVLFSAESIFLSFLSFTYNFHFHLSVSLLTSEKCCCTANRWVRLSDFPVFHLSVFLSVCLSFHLSVLLSFC